MAYREPGVNKDQCPEPKSFRPFAKDVSAFNEGPLRFVGPIRQIQDFGAPDAYPSGSPASPTFTANWPTGKTEKKEATKHAPRHPGQVQNR